MEMTKRFTYRDQRIEIWQGNDTDGKLGYLPWFWRPLKDQLRINWTIMGPSLSRDAAENQARATIDRILDWYPVR
jgi:hypothetical protein